MTDSILIGPTELHARLASDAPPVVLDVRWALGDSDGFGHYRAQHIPSAVYVDLDTELAARPSPAAGRHPLPNVASLQKAARSWGIRQDSPVVVYDAATNTSSARAWWLLRWAGLENVQLLDGGLHAWTAQGLPTESGDATAHPEGNVQLTSGALPTLDIDDVSEWPRSGILLDARAPERFSGSVEPVDPRAGHIPEAVNAPTTQNLSENNTFLTPQQLRKRFAAVDVTIGSRVAVYCGSGVTAAHEIAALAIAGIPATLYPGSFSQWSSDPDRPIEIPHLLTPTPDRGLSS